MEYYKKYRLIQNISLAESFNRIIHFFHKLPLIGRLTGDKYRFYGLKKFIFVLGPIFSLLGQLFKSFLSLTFAVGAAGALIWITNIPWVLNNELFKGFYDLSFASLAFLSIYLTGAILSNAVVDDRQNIWTLNRQLRMHPKASALAYAVFGPLRIAIARAVVFCIILDTLDAFLVSFILMFIRIIANAVNLNIYKESKKNHADNLFVIFAVFFVLFFLLKNRAGFSTTFLLVVFVLGLIGSVISAKYLFAYKGYGEILEIAGRDSINISTDFEQIANDSLALKDEDLTSNIDTKGRGYEYLNNLFFARHRRLIIKPILKKAAIMFGLMVLAFGLLKFKYPELSANINKYITIVMAELMFILYNNESTSRAMFLNCDRPLMKYGFYKDRSAIFDMYKYRYKSLLKLNSLGLGAAIIALVLAFAMFKEITRSELIVYIFFIVASFTFYPAYNLANYYLLQPYNYEANQKGHAYKLVAAIMGYVNILFIPLFIINGIIDGRATLKILGIVMLILSLIFTLVVKVYGHKTFKIKD